MNRSTDIDNGTSLVLTRRFPVPRKRVFEAWTDEDIVRRWFCPDEGMTVPVAVVDAREGGSYRIVVEDKDGKTYSPSGVYETVVPNEQLIFSWKWADSDLITRVTLDFREIGDAETELTLTHEGFPETEIRDRHNLGWQGCLSKLATIFN